MMTLRPKHSFESVVANLATGLTSGTVRLSTAGSEPASSPREQAAHYSKAHGNRPAMSPKEDSVILHPIAPSLKK